MSKLADTDVSQEYLEFIVALFVGFERFVYQNLDMLKDLRWDPDPEKTRIVITGEYPENEAIYKPIIVASRGDVSWMTLSFDKYKTPSIPKPLGMDNLSGRKMRLVAGTMVLQHYSQRAYESSTLAWLSFLLISAYKDQFRANGLQYLDSVILSRTTPAAGNLYTTSVLVKWQAKVEWIFEKVANSLTNWSIILEDAQMIWNEIDLTYNK